MAATRADVWSGTTAWARRFKSPLREFLRTESGGAAVLLAATTAALVWVNVDASSYEELWGAVVAIGLGDNRIELTLREVVNSGLMTFFFFVLGMEARREFDLGDFRERRRFVLPLLVSLGGMGSAVGIYLAFNLGSSAAEGWGIAMSTDTAFALGLLTLFGPRAPDRLRAFILTVVIADDLLALVVIALVYSDSIDVMPLIWAASLFAVALVLLFGLKLRRGPPYLLVGSALWVLALESGIEPLVVGLAFGLLVSATPAARPNLEHAGKRFREFREQPTPELQHMARESIRTAISPNERLQLIYHPWTSYVIVPLFALAKAGLAIDGAFLERAARSPITFGVLVGYVAGKPLGIVGTGAARHPAVTRATATDGRLGRRRRRRRERRRRLHRLPVRRHARLRRRTARGGQGRHPRRPRRRCCPHVAGVPHHRTSFAAAPYCRPARRRKAAPRPRVHGRPRVGPHPRSARRAGDRGRVRRLRVPVLRTGGAPSARAAPRLRGRPLRVAAPAARRRASARRAGGTGLGGRRRSGRVPGDSRRAARDQDKLRMADLVSYADRLGLDVARFTEDLQGHVGANRIARDVEGADLSRVSGTPTFFINGRRHHGAYDIDTLSRAVRAAGARAKLAAS